MIVRGQKTLLNPRQRERNFQRDIVALKIFDFATPRTWEVIENKSLETSFLTMELGKMLKMKQLQEMSVNIIFVVTNCRSTERFSESIYADESTSEFSDSGRFEGTRHAQRHSSSTATEMLMNSC